ncbi:uncharacterized protein LOC111627152 [Centruroides sculpturatus]|uniref:uncharacterized protein LOC111627152 n=1 Tax=Centruroides sculpturatus TaxID=218467 RepID=UPI000C6D0E67|nr:uncharacterized protein LOC111627152 [Centruroides sculpturatus]
MSKKSTDPSLKALVQQFRDSTIILPGETPQEPSAVFSSGSLVIDELTGVGGFVRGKIVEIYGPESSGKTTLALLAISQVQKEGGKCVFIDAEHALDLEFAGKLNVDKNKLIFVQPSSAEQALEITDALAKTGAVDLIVIDSVAALIPQTELEGCFEDNTIGLQARLMSKALRKITATLAQSQTSVIFINQIREKINHFSGPTQVTPGGRALKFYASLRLEVRRIGYTGVSEAPNGVNLKVKCVKNKLAPPYRVGQIHLSFNHGLDQNNELIDLLISQGSLTSKGGWYQ